MADPFPTNATKQTTAMDNVREDLRVHVVSWLGRLAADKRRAMSGGMKHGTVVNYLSAVVVFCEWLRAQNPSPGIEWITPAAANGFVRWLQLDRKYKPRTIQLKISALSSLWAAMVGKGTVPHNPWTVIQVPFVLIGHSKFLTDDQDFAWLSNADLQKDRGFFCALLVMRFAGLKLSEAFALRSEDVDLRPGNMERGLHDLLRIFVHRGKDRTTFMLAYPNKRGVDPGTYQGIFLKFAESRKGENSLFPRGKTSFVGWYEKHRKVGDLPADFTPHRLRHTFAAWLSVMSYPLEVIQGLLGNESRETTMTPSELESKVFEQDQGDPGVKRRKVGDGGAGNP